uniref:Uncharacterized protein n=1 Tax=Karlodinium veneficum TaxID=407301 RepID=E8Z724_KARVE|nr:unknown [Karlodinium veneficum]
MPASALAYLSHILTVDVEQRLLSYQRKLAESTAPHWMLFDVMILLQCCVEASKVLTMIIGASAF